MIRLTLFCITDPMTPIFSLILSHFIFLNFCFTFQMFCYAAVGKAHEIADDWLALSGCRHLAESFNSGAAHGPMILTRYS